jgi:hypothetical protein
MYKKEVNVETTKLSTYLPLFLACIGRMTGDCLDVYDTQLWQTDLNAGVLNRKPP